MARNRLLVLEIKYFNRTQAAYCLLKDVLRTYHNNTQTDVTELLEHAALETQLAYKNYQDYKEALNGLQSIIREGEKGR